MAVSIIIPCYSHGSTLERAVASALRQANVTEVIVVDDASDQSITAAPNQIMCDSRIRIYSMESNRGAGAARNRGVVEATGRFICFLNANDELMNDFIGEALQMFRDNPELIAAKCEMEFFDPLKGYILPKGDPRHQAAVLSSPCGMLIRREYLLRLGGFPEDSVLTGIAGSEDGAFMQAVMKLFQPIARIERPGYRVWSRPGSHLDWFLANTRLTDSDSFEFFARHVPQEREDMMADSLAQYLKIAEERIMSTSETVNL